MNPSSASTSPSIVALTGSIGSGKSQAAEIFRECGAHILDADVIAREVVLPGSKGLEAIKQTFGEQYLLPTGELNRAKLGALVFSKPEQRVKLEDILHPRIRELYLEKLSALKSLSPAPKLIIYVVPLLFESRYSYPEIDGIIVVSAPKALSIERIMKRDNFTLEQAEKRYQSQMPIEEKESKADFVIRNDSSIENLKLITRKLYAQLLQKPPTRKKR